ncbi:MAG: hypothetical protein K0M40_17845 [Prolixibacteraceae bacterium]|nr:hypothetical protein [Prolixibacteraceae bacterium]
MMKLNIQHTAKRAIAYLILGLMGLLIINKAVFLHSHVLADGTVISHAHPYQSTDDSKPFQSHHHTKAAFFLFNNIELFFYSFPFGLIFFIPDLRTKVFISGFTQIAPEYFSSTRNRAPPVILFK